MPEKPNHPTIPREYAIWLFRQLNEYSRGVHAQIFTIVELVGIEATHRIYQRTLEIEANGGLMTNDGQTRRTIGGVFFIAAREILPEYLPDASSRRPWDTGQSKYRAQHARVLKWADRFQVVDKIQQQGIIDTMRVTLTGYPGDVVQQGNTVVMQMQHAIEPHYEYLAVGTPRIDITSTLYTVYIAEKLWRKVEADLQKPNRRLHVIGYCVFDPETQSMAVIGEHVKTEKVKQPKAVEEGTEEKPAPEEAVPDEPAPPPAPPKLKKVVVEVPSHPVPPLTLPDDVPADVAAKAQELHAAIAKFQDKIANLKANNQKAGIKMTERLLENTESQLAALLSPYK